MKIAGKTVDWRSLSEGGNVVTLYEDRDIYDGWAVAQLVDGSLVNRWASNDDPSVSIPGYERRFRKTQKFIEDLKTFVEPA